ncbi:MAG: NUDIX hydrolase [Candidatus Moraniibacteriota bacterium]
MGKNIFRGEAESPYHLSVGAVLVNEKGEVATHYFKEFETFEKVKFFDFYLLMRETVEPGESIEGAVSRGIKEEFGATGEIERFLGTLVTKFLRRGTWIEKTTTYFLVSLESFDLNLQTKDGETRVSQVQWQSIDFLIEKMKEQGKKYERTDLDESIILERAKKFIESK